MVPHTSKESLKYIIMDEYDQNQNQKKVQSSISPYLNEFKSVYIIKLKFFCKFRRKVIDSYDNIYESNILNFL